MEIISPAGTPLYGFLSKPLGVSKLTHPATTLCKMHHSSWTVAKY